MNDNLTTINKYLITDIDLTQVNSKGNITNSAAIENITDEIKILNENIKIFNTVDQTREKQNESFIIPKNIGKFSISTKNYFNNTQRWIGHIVELHKETFTAKLEDLSSPLTYEYAEFDYKEVPPDDSEYISVGNVFYWSVGYNVSNGQVLKASVIKFQRLPYYDMAEQNRKVKIIDAAVDNVDELLAGINWD